jgi:hypothetical protein
VTTLWLDLETYSETPITQGTYRYAETAEVMLVAYAFDDEPVEVIDLTAGGSLDNVQLLIDSADKVVIHNSNFDRTVLRCNGVHVPLSKVEDTMAQALAHSLPGSLGALCDVLGVPQDKAKDKHGQKLIHLLTKPRPRNVKLRRATRETHPEEWAAFIEYARLDVDAMRDVSRRLPRWNSSGSERRVWLLDQHVNDRGIAVDVGLAEAALRAFQRSARSLAERAGLLTNGAVPSLTQAARFTAYLKSIGYETPDLTKGTVAAALKGDLPQHVRELLEIRQQASATSPAKYKVLINGVSSDSRLRGLLQYCGASRTGRWGGRLFQPQNLPRPTLKQDMINAGIDAMKADCEDLLFDNVSELCSSAVRGALVASPGKKLVVADLSNIEGRVLAWLADEKWKISAFADFDKGIGHDLYKLAYARSFNVPPERVSKDERQIGKVMELACLGPDTCVLTNNGVKAITKVGANDLLWDGEEWVKHEGLIDRGNRATIWLEGLELTPDHEVLVGQTWQQAQTVVSCQNTRDHALVTGMVNLPWSAWNSGLWAAYARLKWRVHAAQNLTAWLSATCGKEEAHAATAAPRKPQVDGQNNGLDTLTSARTTRTAAGYATVYPRVSTVAITPTMGLTTITEDAASTSTSRGEPTEPHISRILSRLTDGIDLNSNLTELMSTGVMSRVISVSLDGELTVTTCDVFETCSSESTNLRPVYDITNAGPRNRFTVLTNSGALIVHNCGYQGGLGAFNTMAKAYGLSLPDDEVAANVTAWRKAHPAIKSFWYALEGACEGALLDEGKIHKVGLLSVIFKDTWLRIKLPSGRWLCYPNAAMENGRIVYDGTNQFTKKWERIETYGGKICENIVQATARDVLASGLLRAEAAGYAVCLHVHDEIIAEVPDTDEYSAEGLSKIMSHNPGWSLGLPLAAAGFECYRYRKD